MVSGDGTDRGVTQQEKETTVAVAVDLVGKEYFACLLHASPAAPYTGNHGFKSEMIKLLG